MGWEPWADTKFWLLFNLIAWPLFIAILFWMFKRVRVGK